MCSWRRVGYCDIQYLNVKHRRSVYSDSGNFFLFSTSDNRIRPYKEICGYSKERESIVQM